MILNHIWFLPNLGGKTNFKDKSKFNQSWYIFIKFRFAEQQKKSNISRLHQDAIVKNNIYIVADNNPIYETL